jgi:hypothetical protein
MYIFGAWEKVQGLSPIWVHSASLPGGLKTVDGCVVEDKVDDDGHFDDSPRHQRHLARDQLGPVHNVLLEAFLHETQFPCCTTFMTVILYCCTTFNYYFLRCFTWVDNSLPLQYIVRHCPTS